MPSTRPSKPEDGALVLRGVRVHNLKGVDLELPRHRLIAISGVSGSGKSSLAFDTLYAEGRRRYVECLSTYTRQFLDRTDRPDLDAAEGLPPAIAVERKPPASQARSTVGTSTEIHDYLRLLFARLGVPRCPACSRVAVADTIDGAAGALAARSGRGVVTFDLDHGRGRWDALRERLRAAGFARVFRDGAPIRLEDAGPRDGAVEVVVDRVELSPDRRARIAEALDTAYRFGHDRARVHFDDGTHVEFARALHCPGCGRSFRPPEPNLFSPNSPLGACPTCQGFGRSVGIDMERVVPDRSKTLRERPVDPWTKPAYVEAWRDLRRAGRRIGLAWDVPYAALPEEHRRLVEDGGEGFYGIRGFFQWLEGRTYKVHVRVFLARYRAYTPCPACSGSRLNPEALAVLVDGTNVAEVASWPVERTLAWVRERRPAGAAAAAAAPVLEELERRLSFLAEVGLGYLSLDRASRTLSGGEAQRILLARCLGSGLVDTLYVLDEPSVGLHPSDVARLLGVLRHLRDLGNTVVMTEHDPSLLEAADWLVDIGPEAGERGGRIVYAGPPEGIKHARGSLTGRWLSGRDAVAAPGAAGTTGADGWIELDGASIHNLNDLSVRFPRRALSVVTGVSGSGKSSLVEDTLHGAVARTLGTRPAAVGPYRALRGVEGFSGVELVDQSPIGRSPRSNPVTYVGAFEGIRRKLATTTAARGRGLKPGYFSFNVPGGRCEACEGAGARLVEMHFLPDMLVTCEACGGRRFGPEALTIRWNGLSVADILALTVTEARALFGGDAAIAGPLALLEETGLGYLRLGQPAPTLSGGEAQRLKLATHLAGTAKGGGKLLLLDEPTTGLHLHDLAALVRLLRRLVAAGHTIICVEHHLDLILAADWVVDLGPGAGPNGGRLVAEGAPERVARSTGETGRFLRAALEARRLTRT